jgi:ABC-type branched-subunit amino acid transport system substrate-binding protein
MFNGASDCPVLDKEPEVEPLMRMFKPVIATVVAAPLLLSACGANSDSNASAGGSGSSAPIKLLVISQLQAASFAFPEIADGAKAAAEAVNAAGGVNGHKIQVDSCNDEGDPNVAATCGRKAVQGGYAAVLNSTSLYSASFMPLLEAGKVPAVGSTPLTPPDFTSPVTFPIGGGNPLDYGGVGYLSAKDGCKNAGIIRDTAAAVDSTTMGIEKGFEAGGGNPIQTVVKASGESADFAAPVSQITSSDVDCLLLAEAPAAVARIVGTVRQSAKPTLPISTLSAAFPEALVKSLGKAAEGVQVNSSFAVPSETDTPTFWADMTKYAPNAPKSGQALVGWAGVQVVKQVAAEAKAYDHAALLDALGKASDVKVEGLASVLDFSKPNPNKDYARIFATSNFAYQVKDGGFSPLFDGKPTDVSAVLQ